MEFKRFREILLGILRQKNFSDDDVESIWNELVGILTTKTGKAYADDDILEKDLVLELIDDDLAYISSKVYNRNAPKMYVGTDEQ